MANETDPTRKLKRRGILSAAGAVVAGIVAQQAAQPVTANDQTWSLPYAGQGMIAADLVSFSNFGTGRALNSYSGGPGDAIYASSGSGIGVSVLSGGPFAVKAHSTGNTYGLFADTDSGAGVGVSGTARTGVSGQVPNMANTVAVYGNNTSTTGANNIGVRGDATNGTGIYGQTSASYQYGILGATYATNSTAIAGACSGNGSSAFSGGTTNLSANAGVFQGNVVIQGRLVVSDPSYKSGALQHPDGSTRLVYCIESPESWIEDVGKGQLVDGKTTVTFDKDFTALTHTDDYHVFLTLYGEGDNGINVTERRSDGFTVKERKGGTGNQAFSWKVMVKAKSTVKSERLGRFTMPTIPLPDVSKFKAPEMPVAAVPKKP